MAKYRKYERKSAPKPGTNPLWRGVGCILIVVVPLISYGLMTVVNPLLMASGLVPVEITGYVKFPDWSLRSPFLSGITSFIGGIDNLWLKLIVFFVILLLLTTISSMVYSMIYQLVGPPRYSERDAPPSKQKAKAYKR